MQPAAGSPKPKRAAPRQPNAVGPNWRVHPVVIYPFKQPADYSDLTALYELIAGLQADQKRYARPITVLDRKTHHHNRDDAAYAAFRKKTVSRCSDILDAWCVDTCQMWYSGLGSAFERGGPDDVYWLIPGDFNYATPSGREVLGRLHDLPEITAELGQDLCIGEITTDRNHPKQLIDTYGTFALLYNWFPVEAREIRQITERPRSEFFALRHGFLSELLEQRWYAYEQTVSMLLHGIATQKRISRFFVGAISDLPEGRESFGSVLQQVERTERMLKSSWRERHQSEPDWPARYQILESQSDVIFRTAFHVLSNLLT